jgi:hypothetical protein
MARMASREFMMEINLNGEQMYFTAQIFQLHSLNSIIHIYVQLFITGKKFITIYYNELNLNDYRHS